MRPESWIINRFMWVLALASTALFIGALNRHDETFIIFTGCLTITCFVFAIFFHYMDNQFRKLNSGIGKFTRAVYHQKRRRNFKLIKGGKK